MSFGVALNSESKSLKENWNPADSFDCHMSDKVFESSGLSCSRVVATCQESGVSKRRRVYRTLVDLKEGDKIFAKAPNRLFQEAMIVAKASGSYLVRFADGLEQHLQGTQMKLMNESSDELALKDISSIEDQPKEKKVSSLVRTSSSVANETTPTDDNSTSLEWQCKYNTRQSNRTLSLLERLKKKCYSTLSTSKKLSKRRKILENDSKRIFEKTTRPASVTCVTIKTNKRFTKMRGTNESDSLFSHFRDQSIVPETMSRGEGASGSVLNDSSSNAFCEDSTVNANDSTEAVNRQTDANHSNLSLNVHSKAGKHVTSSFLEEPNGLACSFEGCKKQFRTSFALESHLRSFHRNLTSGKTRTEAAATTNSSSNGFENSSVRPNSRIGTGSKVNDRLCVSEPYQISMECDDFMKNGAFPDAELNRLCKLDEDKSTLLRFITSFLVECSDVLDSASREKPLARSAKSDSFKKALDLVAQNASEFESLVSKYSVETRRTIQGLKNIPRCMWPLTMLIKELDSCTYSKT